MVFRKFKQVFDQLPVMTIGGKDYTPKFMFGTRNELSAYLSLERKKGERYYPLIWLETPMEEASELDCNFLLATQNKKVDMGNWDRLNLTFDQVLEPLLDNILIAIQQSRVFRINGIDKNYRGTKFFNYHTSPDIWDAIKFNVKVRYDRNCEVKNITY